MNEVGEMSMDNLLVVPDKPEVPRGGNMVLASLQKA